MPKFFLGLASSLLLSLSVHAATISNNDYYQTGWAFYRSGQLSEAAKTWQALAKNNEQQGDEQKKQAALSAVLATVLWQNLENPQAYNTWADAIRLYLEANSSWQQERIVLKERIITVRQALQQLSGDVIPTVEPFMSLLLEMDSRYGLTEFETPKSGLKLNSETDLLDVNQNFLVSPQQTIDDTLINNSTEVTVLPQGESNNEQTIQTLNNQQHFAIDVESTKDQNPLSNQEPVLMTTPVDSEIAIPDRGHLTTPEDVNKSNEVNIEGTAFQRHVIPNTDE